MGRSAEVRRKTAETEITLRIDLDGKGKHRVEIGLGFLTHMLELLARHSLIDLSLQASGDLEVDDHHLTEDIGIALGQAIGQALGDKRGIRRYGSVMLPMDEVLAAVAVDLSGRFAYRSDYQPIRERLGDFSTELANHFFSSLACRAGMNLHFRLLSPGENEHHRIEALFKGFARALRQAVELDPREEGEVPSSKGVL